MCVTGVPYLYDPSGALQSCAQPIEIQGFGDLASELAYLIDRLPAYVVATGAVVGLGFLFLCALVVKGLMS